MWSLADVLPPQAGLTVGSVRYTYEVQKQVEDAFTVHIEMLDNTNTNVLHERIDDWSGLPGQKILRTEPVDDLVIERLGNGQIRTEGDGTISNTDVRYGYTYDTCFDPITDPTCPGYAAALLAFLKDNGLLDQSVDVEDPYWNDVVQKVLNEQTPEQRVEEEVEETLEEEKEEEENLEKMLAIKSGANKLADEVAQGAILAALASNEKIVDYTTMAQIPGGILQNEIPLTDKKINDNRKAAVRMGLAQDKIHNALVDLQYD